MSTLPICFHGVNRGNFTLTFHQKEKLDVKRIRIKPSDGSRYAVTVIWDVTLRSLEEVLTLMRNMLPTGFSEKLAHCYVAFHPSRHLCHHHQPAYS